MAQDAVDDVRDDREEGNQEEDHPAGDQEAQDRVHLSSTLRGGEGGGQASTVSLFWRRYAAREERAS